MIQVQFNNHDVDKLYDNFLQFSHPKVRLKNLALYLKCMGFAHNKICELCRITKPTLASYLKGFQTGGFESLEQLNWKGQQSDLNSYREIIDADFSTNPPKSIQEAQSRIESLTGIKRCPTQIREFLRSKLNYRYLKAGSLPRNWEGR